MNKTQGRKETAKEDEKENVGEIGTEEKEDGHNGGHMPAGSSRRRRARRRPERLRVSVQRERKIMRCFCIIRYIQTLCRHGGSVYAWSIQRNVTRRVQVLPVGPHILGRSPPSSSPASPSGLPCSSSPSGSNLRVSETGRAVPKARVPLLHLSVQLLFFLPLSLPSAHPGLLFVVFHLSYKQRFVRRSANFATAYVACRMCVLF